MTEDYKPKCRNCPYKPYCNCPEICDAGEYDD